MLWWVLPYGKLFQGNWNKVILVEDRQDRFMMKPIQLTSKLADQCQTSLSSGLIVFKYFQKNVIFFSIQRIVKKKKVEMDFSSLLDI